jgi:hypothetical protein
MLRRLPNAQTLVFNRLALIAWQLKREPLPQKRRPHRCKKALTFPRNSA